MTTYLVNQTPYQMNVPLFNPATSEKSSVFVQPNGRIKLLDTQAVPEEFLTLNPRVRVFSVPPKEAPPEVTDADQAPSKATGRSASK